MSRKAKNPSDVRRELVVGDEEFKSPTTIIEVDTVIRGRRYQANFVFNVPSIGEQITIGQMKSVYLPNGATADANAQMIVEQICYLEVCLKDPKPEWWKPLEFMEGDLLAEVYSKGVAYANNFLGRDAVPGSATDEDGREDGRGDDATPESDVVTGVQTPDQSSPTLINDSKGA